MTKTTKKGLETMHLPCNFFIKKVCLLYHALLFTMKTTWRTEKNMLGLPFAKINKSLNKLAGDYNDYLFVYSILSILDIGQLQNLITHIDLIKSKYVK